MKRVLFVDDDQAILSGLQRMLRPQRKEWDMSFALGGEEALGLLGEGDFDAVVSDMRMPGMDGAELLEEVRRRQPDAYRVVLSGQMDNDTAFRSATVAHHFLTKPCDAETLVETLTRTAALRERLPNPELRRALGQLPSLPSPSAAITDLQQCFEAPEPQTDRIVEIISADPAMSAKVLQLANCAFFGLPQRVSEVRSAVSYLGQNVVRSLVTGAVVFQAFDACGKVPAEVFAFVQGESLEVAELSASLAKGKADEGDAFVAGLLHDVGLLALALAIPDSWQKARARADETGQVLFEAETDLFGSNHSEVGAYLLELWGIPAPVVDAIASHHTAHLRMASTSPLGHAVHVASTLVSERLIAVLRGRTESALTAEYLEATGLTAAVAAWRNPADHLAASPS